MCSCRIAIDTVRSLANLQRKDVKIRFRVSARSRTDLLYAALKLHEFLFYLSLFLSPIFNSPEIYYIAERE